VAFSVRGTELFGPQDQPFTNLALLHVAMGLAKSVNDCVTHEESRFELLGAGGSALTLRCTGRIVEVRGPGGAVAYDTVDAILRAVSVFADSVREFLLSEFPDLADDETYGWWFRDEART
jgi:hypothetical protein